MATAWELTGSPLRPSPEDAEGYWRFASKWIAQHGAPRTLLLGVTPEIYGLPWPEGTDFLAVDQGAAMINHVWPGSREQVLQANWLELPLPPGSRDIALCDGGLHLLKYPGDQQRLAQRLAHVLAPGGYCIFRLFLPPAQPETPEAVLSDLFQGAVPNLNVLKLRLGMALQTSPEEGIAVRLIREKLLAVAGGGWEQLAARLEWPVDHLAVVDAYQHSTASYHFASQGDVERIFCDQGDFELQGAIRSKYPLGDRCPILLFKRC